MRPNNRTGLGETYVSEEGECRVREEVVTEEIEEGNKMLEGRKKSSRE